MIKLSKTDLHNLNLLAGASEGLHNVDLKGAMAGVRKLAAAGLIEQFTVRVGGYGHFHYRITEAGREALGQR